jgi:hypothetical protein
MYPPVTQFETRDLEIARQLQLMDQRYLAGKQSAKGAAQDRLRTALRRLSRRPQFESGCSECPA